MYPENLEGTRVIVGSVSIGYVSDTARIRTRNLFRPKCAPIPLGHSDMYKCISMHYPTCYPDSVSISDLFWVLTNETFI